MASRFYLERIKSAAELDGLPTGTAMECFVKTSGDTVGLVLVNGDGRFSLMHNGETFGPFGSIMGVYRELDRIDA